MTYSPSTQWNKASVLWITAICLLTGVRSEKMFSNGVKVPIRPKLVIDSLEKSRPIYYFGLGSNMSRKKIENRGLNGTKIELQTMEPAVVPNYRLSFNMRGFPPLEPGMGSLEPVDSGVKSLLKYEHGECHGALIKLTPENYEKVMRSEGVGNGRSDQGYEEIIVDAYPYGKPGKPVKAVALRARDHVRLNYDPRPSVRYMSILKEGAKELGLRPCYQDFLERHPVQVVTKWQRKEAIFNVIFMFSVSAMLKWRGLTNIQSRLLFLFHSFDSFGTIGKLFGVTMTSIILLPGALMGLMMYQIMELTGKTPESAKRIMTLLDKDHS